MKKTAAIVIILIASFFAVDIGRFFIYPDISKLKKKNPKKTAFMEGREREWKKKGKKLEIRSQWVPLSKMSVYLKKAVIIGEDERFWTHEGFDVEAMEKALLENIRKGGFKKGGSTITQQLAKNLYLNPSKNPIRKIKEAIIAWRIERTLSKGRILELYLNIAEWGEGIFGAEAASMRYFKKTSSDLTPQEASMLVAVLPNPRRYNPENPSGYPTRRAEAIYNIMVKRGIVIEEPEYIEVPQEGETPAQSQGIEENPPNAVGESIREIASPTHPTHAPHGFPGGFPVRNDDIKGTQ